MKMINQIFLIFSVLTLVVCEPRVAQYGVPFNNNAGSGGGYNNYNQNVGHGVNNGIGAPVTSYGPPSYDNNQHGGHGGHGGHDEGYGEPKAYEFGYQVKDDYTGTNYNRQEQSDGNQVTGSYRVALPDGRTQIVTYYADWKTGFHADVRYEGEAQYPEQYNNNNNNGGYNYNNNNNNNQGFAHNQGYNNNQGFNNNQGVNQGYNNYNSYNNQNQHYNAPSGQYGAPVNPIAINNQYAALSNSYGTPNTGNYDNYNNNQNYNQNNYNHGQTNYDSYNSGFGNKVKPTAVYGAP